MPLIAFPFFWQSAQWLPSHAFLSQTKHKVCFDFMFASDVSRRRRADHSVKGEAGSVVVLRWSSAGLTESTSDQREWGARRRSEEGTRGRGGRKRRDDGRVSGASQGRGRRVQITSAAQQLRHQQAADWPPACVCLWSTLISRGNIHF